MKDLANGREGARRVLLCVLAAALVGALWIFSRFIGAGEPLVDLSQRARIDLPAHAGGERKKGIRFAVASMVNLESTFQQYRQLVKRVCRDAGYEETFVLRPSYADVRHALEEGQVDVAFVCTGTYVCAASRGRLKLLVQPELQGGRDYRSLLVVPSSSSAKTWSDVRGGVMAFTDPESFTGCLVPSLVLAERGDSAASFFRRTVFTGSHDRSIQAVAQGIVDMAAVDSLIWDAAKRDSPDLARRVKVLWSSECFGPPPVVVPKSLDATREGALRRAFLSLSNDVEGRRILSAIGIKRFVPARPEDYYTAIAVCKRFRAITKKEQCP
ncbi:MAG: phosphate/phosphite/phosphonate ABC transporter substrate-binding protein [Planctomycetes bacterium]|nr:phosphate/phosphite/phosphonate ABC transporter substrate-binding protein [Planctomycetota bacterium]